MPRYVVVTVGCDWDGCETVAPEGDDAVTELTIALDGKPGKTVLLCQGHRQRLVDATLLPLMQKGVKAEQPKKAAATRSRSNGAGAGTGAAGNVSDDSGSSDGELVCVDCHRSFKNRTGLAQHVGRTHNYDSLDEYEKAHGLVA